MSPTYWSFMRPASACKLGEPPHRLMLTREIPADWQADALAT